MKEFRTKQLNIFVSGNDKPWFTGDEVSHHFRKIDPKNIRDANCNPPDTMVAVDLSVKDDFSAISYNMYLLDSFHVHTVYYIPDGALSKHKNKDLYKKWVKEGYLKVCGKKSIDYDMMAIIS